MRLCGGFKWTGKDLEENDPGLNGYSPPELALRDNGMPRQM